MEYALWPKQNVSVRVLWGREKQNVVITVGHSVLDRSCLTDVGSLMLRYGGGGHHQVGTCQVEVAKADQVLAEIVEALKTAG
jgi:nanoRNase/pAp phosphatase (c-di-AMP/oligoRNAs hydrolase)